MSEKLTTNALQFLLTETIYVIPEDMSTSVVEEPKSELLQLQTPKYETQSKTIEIPKIPVITSPPLPKNRNQVVIIYNNIQGNFLIPEDKDLLGKILSSVKLRLEDVDLVNANTQRDTLIEILKDKVVNQIISFGIEFRELDIQIPLEAYKTASVEGVDILLVDSLFELQLNTDKKKLLWKCLQTMFLQKK
ncbi:hypothetical protein [Xanthocytophaga agilis]|uniref:Uncharacterized protein n=1 Tax=Xanthocytophaga agilis TaxID=3048010 RepID=A0AAE3R3A0_9BACT|nr:hypothetical protein [Xanthocytophaga agilis]MDJ1500063.1 hypothetical protein [Xanthocytophaga agilis]